MVEQLKVQNRSETPFITFLQLNDFEVEKLTDAVLKVNRLEELPVFIHTQGTSLFFQVDLGNVSEIDSRDLFFKCLDLNTEILPVSIGMDTTNEDDPRLVLVESREFENLDENELLSVFNALEIATDKVEKLLSGLVE